MALDQHLRKIITDNGREVYINVLDIRSFYNYESKLIIEMIDGTTYTVNGAPSVDAFYNAAFVLEPFPVALPPIVLNFVHSVVNVANVDTLVLSANPNRRYLTIRRGTTIGRVFVKFSAGAATETNGDLYRENQYEKFEGPYIHTGEIRAISKGSSKLLYITEGSLP